MHTPLLLSSALLALSHTSVPADDAPVQETLDVRYGDDSALQGLDVFAPKDAANRPVVLFVHGGAWTIGDKSTFGYYRGVARFFARHGAVAVCINYRLAPFAKHPDQVKDVARAFAWTRAHARAYGGDADRIFLCGHSAGGHLVSLLATDETYLKDPALGLTAADRAAIKGVLSVSGIYRIPTQEEFNAMLDSVVLGLTQLSNNSTLASLLGPALQRQNYNLNPFRLAFGDDNAAAQQAAPLTYVRARACRRSWSCTRGWNSPRSMKWPCSSARPSRRKAIRWRWRKSTAATTTSSCSSSTGRTTRPPRRCWRSWTGTAGRARTASREAPERDFIGPMGPMGFIRTIRPISPESAMAPDPSPGRMARGMRPFSPPAHPATDHVPSTRR